MRTVCVVTGSRAEYGLLYDLMREIQRDPDLKLQVSVTGMHLMEEFGRTVEQIEQDGFPISARVDNGLTDDRAESISKAIGKGIHGFSEAFARLIPDLVVVLGDRFEIFAACVAAVPLRIPIAHLHGGEASQGAIDEVFRHCITKMSYLHFVSAEPYRQRVIQMGEDPKRVFCYGAIGLEKLDRFDYLSRSELARELKLKFNRMVFVVTFHPVTLEQATAGKQFQVLLRALDAYPEAEIIFTQPNADTEGRVIMKLIKSYVAQNPKRTVYVQTLGRRKYLSVLKCADLVLGNSSSAVVEAPALNVPAVNIGDRQKGRLMPRGVLSCPPERTAILNAMKEGLDSSFKESFTEDRLPFPVVNTSVRIVEELKRAPLSEEVLKKKFYDLPSMEALMVEEQVRS